VPARAVLRNAALRGVVDVDDPEALAVPLGPLEVVEERPDEVPAKIDSVLERLVNGAHVLVEIRETQAVVNGAVGVDDVVEGGTVLGDDERNAVVASQAAQELE